MRGKKAPRRTISPDPKFNSQTIAKLTNYIMKNGKKSVAQGIVYDAFEIILEKQKQDPVSVFEQALKNVTPQVEVRSKRVGGSNFQVPIEVRGDRKIALGFRWILDAARSKKGKPMCKKLAEEIMSASKGEGTAVKKKEDVHRMAESNRAFAHFA
jgi:small subunit ribosomal protein S7